MRLAIMTDIHGNYEALKAVMADIKTQNCDDIYSLGDNIAIGPCPKEVMDYLIQEKVKMILGNHEQYYLMDEDTLCKQVINETEINHQKWVQKTLGEDYKSLISSLPLCKKITIGQMTLQLMHYPIIDNWYKPFVKDPSIEELYDLFEADSNELFVFGHHHPKHDVYDKSRNIHYVNPGALGCTVDNFAPYVIIDIDKTSVHISFRSVEYNRKRTLEQLDEKLVPERTIIKKIFFGEK